MIGLRDSDDFRPLTWIGRVPVYFSTVLVAVFAAAMVGCAVAASARVPLEGLLFSAERLVSGAFWTPLTCTFVQLPNFFSALGLLCLYSVGAEVEKFIGRRRYANLLVGLMLLPAAILIPWWLAGMGTEYGGTYMVTAALLIAFATLYPNAEWFGSIPLKWIAAAGLLLGSMMFLPERRWVDLSLLWGMCAFAFGYIRVVQRGGLGEVGAMVSEMIPPRRRVPVVSAARRTARHVDSPETPPTDPVASIDPLLDKIAEHGLASLTEEERQKLEDARQALIKRK